MLECRVFFVAEERLLGDVLSCDTSVCPPFIYYYERNETTGPILVHAHVHTMYVQSMWYMTEFLTLVNSALRRGHLFVGCSGQSRLSQSRALWPKWRTLQLGRER